MRLAIHPDGNVVVTASPFFGADAIERFVAHHSQWIERQIARTRGKTVMRIKRGEIAALKKRALAAASARCEHFAKIYGFTYRKISIRAQKTRWGSCSLAGNLSFNYKIAVLPQRIADYIIVHELCHLAEMNHSKKFWAQVARAVPGHAALRKELRAIAFVFY
jgi:predicted metal-dependent hydrolase